MSGEAVGMVLAGIRGQGSLAGWDQTGKQHRMAQPHRALMCIGIRVAVKDMSRVHHVLAGKDKVSAYLSRLLERGPTPSRRKT